MSTEVWQHVAYVAGTTDSQGNAADGYGSPVPVAGCMFDPGGSAEPGFQRRVVIEPTLYVPHRTVGPQDRFLGRGGTWEVNGEVGDWGAELPVVVHLRRVDG